LSQGSPRRRPLTPERLDQVDLDTALRLYRERFADASGFTFFLVGNFTPDSVREPVLTYLGGLPSRGGKESFRDVGVRPPAGVVKVAVDKGLEPKSQVQIVFSGPAQFSLDANHDLQALTAVMRIRLREVLREDLGAIYGVSVGGSVSQRPWQSYRLAVSFGCAPENVDRLVAAVFAEIAALREKGVAVSYVQKVQEGERRQREVDLKSNPFWMTALRTYYVEGLDPREILRSRERIEQLTPERLAAAARLYLPADRYVLAVLKPEAAAAAPAKAKSR
ncbi:MAG TPA: insulinase family protein, partial [Thermoanaerobaculia bacterium]